ncbi:MAG: DsbA family protein, partial [Rhodovibrionaceae bacterium]|nr:DsbA family protein [Rhodovibrionaceae bacterium]
ETLGTGFKRMADDMRDLIQGDENLKVIMREFPILSEGSRFAARAALAARKQGKYEEFHFALLRAKGRVNEQLTLVIAENVGIDVERLRADMDGPEIQAHIDESRRLAEVLGVRGTPAFVVGSEFIPGAVSLSQLREAIEEARKES